MILNLYTYKEPWGNHVNNCLGSCCRQFPENTYHYHNDFRTSRTALIKFTVEIFSAIADAMIDENWQSKFL